MAEREECQVFLKKKTVGDSAIDAVVAVTNKRAGKEVGKFVKTAAKSASKTSKSVLTSGTKLVGDAGSVGMKSAKKAFEKSKDIAGHMKKDLKGLRETSDKLLKEFKIPKRRDLTFKGILGSVAIPLAKWSLLLPPAALESFIKSTEQTFTVLNSCDRSINEACTIINQIIDEHGCYYTSPFYKFDSGNKIELKQIFETKQELFDHMELKKKEVQENKLKCVDSKGNPTSSISECSIKPNACDLITDAIKRGLEIEKLDEDEGTINTAISDFGDTVSDFVNKDAIQSLERNLGSTADTIKGAVSAASGAAAGVVKYGKRKIDKKLKGIDIENYLEIEEFDKQFFKQHSLYRILIDLGNEESGSSQENVLETQIDNYIAKFNTVAKKNFEKLKQEATELKDNCKGAGSDDSSVKKMCDLFKDKLSKLREILNIILKLPADILGAQWDALDFMLSEISILSESVGVKVAASTTSAIMEQGSSIVGDFGTKLSGIISNPLSASKGSESEGSTGMFGSLKSMVGMSDEAIARRKDTLKAKLKANRAEREEAAAKLNAEKEEAAAKLNAEKERLNIFNLNFHDEELKRWLFKLNIKTDSKLISDWIESDTFLEIREDKYTYLGRGKRQTDIMNKKDALLDIATNDTILKKLLQILGISDISDTMENLKEAMNTRKLFNDLYEAKQEKEIQRKEKLDEECERMSDRDHYSYGQISCEKTFTPTQLKAKIQERKDEMLTKKQDEEFSINEWLNNISFNKIQNWVNSRSQ